MAPNRSKSLNLAVLVNNLVVPEVCSSHRRYSLRSRQTWNATNRTSNDKIARNVTNRKSFQLPDTQIPEAFEYGLVWSQIRVIFSLFNYMISLIVTRILASEV